MGFTSYIHLIRHKVQKVDQRLFSNNYGNLKFKFTAIEINGKGLTLFVSDKKMWSKWYILSSWLDNRYQKYSQSRVHATIPDSKFCRLWHCAAALFWWCLWRLLPSWWPRERQALPRPWLTTLSTFQPLPTLSLRESWTVAQKKCCPRTWTKYQNWKG